MLFSLVKNSALRVGSLAVLLSTTTTCSVLVMGQEAEDEQETQTQMQLRPTQAKFQIEFESDHAVLAAKFDESKDQLAGWHPDDFRFQILRGYIEMETVEASNGQIDSDGLTCNLWRPEWKRIQLSTNFNDDDGELDTLSATTNSTNTSTNATTTTAAAAAAATEPINYLYRFVYTLQYRDPIPVEEEEITEEEQQDEGVDLESLARWHVTYFNLPQKEEQLANIFQTMYNFDFPGDEVNGTTAITIDTDTIQVSAISITNNNTEAPINFFYKPPTVAPTMSPSFSQASIARSSYDLRFHTIPISLKDPISFFGNATALASLCEFFILQSASHMTTFYSNYTHVDSAIHPPSCQAKLNGQPSINDNYRYLLRGQRQLSEVLRQLLQRQLQQALSYDISLLVTMRWESRYEDLASYPFEFWKYLNRTQNDSGGRWGHLSGILGSFYYFDDLPPPAQEGGSNIFKIQSFKRTVWIPTIPTNPPTTMAPSVAPSFTPTKSISSPSPTTRTTNPPSFSFSTSPSTMPTSGEGTKSSDNNDTPVIVGVVLGYLVVMSALIYWFVQYRKKQKNQERPSLEVKQQSSLQPVNDHNENNEAGVAAAAAAAAAATTPETRILNEKISHDVNSTYSSSYYEGTQQGAAPEQPPEVEESLGVGPTTSAEEPQQQNHLLHSFTIKVGEGSVRPGEVPEMTEIDISTHTENKAGTTSAAGAAAAATTRAAAGAVEKETFNSALPPPNDNNGGNNNYEREDDDGNMMLPQQSAPPPPVPVRSSILDLPPGESSMLSLPPAPPAPLPIGLEGQHHPQDEFDQYVDTNMERLRSNVITSVPTLDHRMSRAVTNDLINPDDTGDDLSSSRVDLSQMSGIQVEAEVFWEVTEWLKHSKDPSHDEREEHMQELLNKMVRCVRKGKVSPEEASQTIHGVAVLLGLQVSHKLPPTILLKGMVKSTTDQDIINAFQQFGDIDGAAVASGNKGFGIVRFRRDKHAELAMQQYDVVIRDVSVTRELLQS